MSVTKRIVILANSRKASARCVAGRELLDDGRTGAWIRPVRDKDGTPIPYATGVKLQDIYSIRFEGNYSPSYPHSYHTENWVCGHVSSWVKQGEFPLANIDQLLDHPVALWNAGRISQYGKNDSVGIDLANEKFKNSLYLIRVDKVTIEVYHYQSGARNSLNLRAYFTYNGYLYAIRVTDPVCESKYQSKDEGNYKIGPCYITVSLGTEFNGRCYKLAAAVIESA